MNFRRMILLASQVVAVAAAGAEQPDIRRDAVVIAVEKAAPAVVNIATERIVEYRDPYNEVFSQFFAPYHRRGTQRSLGSGVIVDDSGYLITNFHVVQRASRITVMPADGTQLEGSFVAGSAANDLALVKVARDKPFPFVVLAKDDDVYLGETVIAIGNPFQFGNSVSRGIISSKERQAVDQNGNVVIEGVLQTDAAINPGNSGGPLVNLHGELVGINTAIIQQAQNIGFAVPAKRVAELLGEWLSLEKRKRIWFGVRFKQAGGVVAIAEVQPDSPAARARLAAGMGVVRCDGNPVRSVVELQRHLLHKEAGHKVKLELNDERPRVVEIELVPLPKYSANELAKQRLGLRLQELTPDLVRALALSSQRGVVVADVDRNSAAWKAGLRRGHVIARVGGSDVNNLDDMARVLEDVPRNVNLTLLVISSTRQGNAILEQLSIVAVTTQ
jgi:S1-C subfamily serine protease